MAATLDPVLAFLSYETVEMLRRFRADPSFKHVAHAMGRDERTVARQLLDLNDVFMKNREAALLAREPGRKGYELTPTGVAFLEAFDPILDATLSAVDTATVASSQLAVQCTSNCLVFFKKLRDQVRLKARLKIVPQPRRTAELDLPAALTGDGALTPVSLFSACWPHAEAPEPIAVVEFIDGVEVLPLQLEPFRLISSEDLDLPETVVITEVIDKGVTLLLPPGGAAWRFVEASRAGWAKLRPSQHVPVPDLDFGLKCLKNHLIPNSAMVVHGSIPSEPGVVLHEHALLGVNERERIAVTGVFHRRQAGGGARAHEYATVWRTACALFGEAPEPVRVVGR